MTDLEKKQQQRNQWAKMQRIAAMRDQLQKINQWAMQGNNGALLGEIAGSWLQNYLGKALEKMFITDQKTPSPKYGDYQWDNPDYVGSAVSGAMGGYRPPESEARYKFEKPEYRTPYERAEEPYKTLVPNQSQQPLTTNQKTPLYDEYVDEKYQPKYTWDNILTDEMNKILTMPKETADSEMAKMAGQYYNKGLSWEEMDPLLRYKAQVLVGRR